MEQILACEDISFAYQMRPIISQVSLQVNAGEIMGLLGPNGTGKSTLLGVLSGDLAPQSGRVTLLGKPLDSYERQSLARSRSVMPQSGEFPFSYLVREIVAMGRSCWPKDPQRDTQIIDAALEKNQITPLSDRDVTRLSGGEQARVTFARVLAQQATMVFLDEPTAALDIAHQERTMELCRDLARQGCAVVAVMHDIQLAAAYCDRIALMSGGKVVALGSPEEVITSQRLSQVYQWQIDVIKIPDPTAVGNTSLGGSSLEGEGKVCSLEPGSISGGGPVKSPGAESSAQPSWEAEQKPDISCQSDPMCSSSSLKTDGLGVEAAYLGVATGSSSVEGFEPGGPGSGFYDRKSPTSRIVILPRRK